MRKCLFILFLSFYCGFAINANTQNDSLMSIGNQQYNNAIYEDAIKTYQQIINNGTESPELYYNTANAYFKLMKLPSAILYYERALKLNPGDEDIIFNLNVANSRIVDKIEQVPAIFLVNWWNSFFNMFSANTWSRISLQIFILLLIFSAIYYLVKSIITKKIFFFSAVILLIINILTFTLAYQKYNKVSSQNEAIIFEPTITIKSSPNNKSVDLFVIHEGTKVIITDQLEGWAEIKIANGSIGWIPFKAIKKI